MPVDAKTAAARQARYDARRREAAEVVPPGSYCYGHTGRMVEKRHVFDNGVRIEVDPYQAPAIDRCPYWKARGDWRALGQGYGYCRLTKMGDRVKHQPKRDGLLWDQCKSCGINDDDGFDDVR